MFSFINKKSGIISPAKGVLKSIEKVNDEAFASRSLGDGFAIEPVDNRIISPVNGTIVFIANELHAFGIQCDNEVELLIHIGIDTVLLKGEGFKSYIKENQDVKQGDLLMTVDFENIKDKVVATDVIVMATSGEKCKINEEGKLVEVGQKKIVEFR